MINATTMTSPFDMMTERNVTGTQKSDSSSDFSDMLSSKLNDQTHEVDRSTDRTEDRNIHQNESKTAEKRKPEAKDDHLEDHSQMEVKQDAVNEDAKSEAAEKSKADSPKDANASETNQKDNSNESKAAADEISSEAVKAQAMSAAQQNANAADTKAAELVAQTLAAQAGNATETKETASTAGTSENATNTQLTQTNSLNSVIATGPDSRNAAEKLVDASEAINPQPDTQNTTAGQANGEQSQVASQKEQLPTEAGQKTAEMVNASTLNTSGNKELDSRPSEDKKTEKAATKTSFFGLSAKSTDTEKSSNVSFQNKKDTGQKSEADSKQEPPLLAGKRQESSRFFVQSTGSENNQEAAFSINPKPDAGKAVSVDTTFSPQVIKAISVESQPAVEVPVIKAATDVQSQNAVSTASDASASAVAMPETRANFDGSIRGLETAKTQTPTPSNAELQSKIMDQIVREIKLRHVQGQSNLTVKLNPAELGQINLQISQTENGLTTQINTTNDQVRGLLQAHIPALTNALAEAGLRMDQVSVTSEASFNSLMQDNNASGTAYQQKNRSRQQHSGNAQEVNINPAVINAANGFGAAGSVGYSWLA